MKPGAIFASPARWNSANKYISSFTPEKREKLAANDPSDSKNAWSSAMLRTWPSDQSSKTNHQRFNKKPTSWRFLGYPTIQNQYSKLVSKYPNKYDWWYSKAVSKSGESRYPTRPVSRHRDAQVVLGSAFKTVHTGPTTSTINYTTLYKYNQLQSTSTIIK